MFSALVPTFEAQCEQLALDSTGRPRRSEGQGNEREEDEKLEEQAEYALSPSMTAVRTLNQKAGFEISITNLNSS